MQKIINGNYFTIFCINVDILLLFIDIEQREFSVEQIVLVISSHVSTMFVIHDCSVIEAKVFSTFITCLFRQRISQKSQTRNVISKKIRNKQISLINVKISLLFLRNSSGKDVTLQSIILATTSIEKSLAMQLNCCCALMLPFSFSSSHGIQFFISSTRSGISSANGTN